MRAIEPSHFSLLEIDGTGFLVAASEVTHVALRSDIVRAADPSSGVFGHVALQHTELPLYVLDGRLHLLDHLPGERRVVVCLRAGMREFALACDAVSPFAPAANHRRQPLPIAQAVSDTPINELLLADERLYFATDTMTLSSYLATQTVGPYEPESTSLAAER